MSRLLTNIRGWRPAVVAAAAAVLFVTGCSSEMVADDPTRPPEEGVTMRPSQSPQAGTCGATFATPKPSPVALRAEFPQEVTRTAATVAGTVQVTSPAEPVTGVITGPEAFLVRDGVIVTVPLPQDSVGRQLNLDAGGTVTLPAQATLVQCDVGTDRTPQPVPTGQYDLYVRLVINHADGSSTESTGGPTRLNVR